MNTQSNHSDAEPSIISSNSQQSSSKPQQNSQQQSAGDISIVGDENATAFVTAAAQATVDQSRHQTIINYYYRELAEISVEDDLNEGDDLPCPYRGLFHFGPEDADYFFGREIFISALVAATDQRTFIPVLGASGSGKSSVVLAGLVPRLQRTGRWQFTHFRPGEDPFHALALALVPLYTPSLQADEQATERMVQARQLADYLRSGRVKLEDVMATIKRHYPSDRILLIADQFEELYALGTAEDTRRRFLDCLLSITAAKSSSASGIDGPPLVVVTTLRADFLGNALAYRQFADELQKGDIKLGAMTPEELTLAIEQPAKKLGVRFEDGLVKRILQDVSNEPGNLPLLEFALTELWKRRDRRLLTHTAYEEIGEVKGALARHADAKYSLLSAAERAEVQRIFVQLVHPGQGTEDTRRLATKSEIGATSWSLVRRLADARLVVTSRSGVQNQETVEVVHEALIRNWSQLRTWIEDDREFRVWQEQLRAAMQQWKSAKRDEGALLRGVPLAAAEENLRHRREDMSADERAFVQQSIGLRDRQIQKEKQRLSVLRKLVVFSSSVAAIAIIAGIAAYRNARVADAAREAAETARQEEARQTEIATGAKQDAENQEAIAISQYSQVLYNWNRDKIDALTEGIRAGKALKQVSRVNPEADNQVKIALQQAIYGISEQNRLQGHDGGVQSVAYSPNGETLATAGRDNTAKIWRLSGEPVATLNGHDDVVWSVAFSPDGKTLATASRDGTVRLWDAKGKTLEVLTGHDGDVYDVAFSPDGQTIASAGDDNTIKLWNTDGKLLQTLSDHSAAVNGVAFSPDGQSLASGSRDRTIKLWTTDGQLTRSIEGHSGSVQSVSFSPDGQELASASEDNTVKLWTLAGENTQTLSHPDMVWQVVYSPDGEKLASVGRVNQVKLWRRSGQEIQTLRGHDANGDVWGVSFSPDGERLATAARDATVKLWTVDRKIESIDRDILVIRAHKGLVEQAEFSPDGKAIASASWDRTVKLWNLEGEEQQVFEGHEDDVWDVSFSPDGKTLASTGRDLSIRLWTLDGEEVRTIQGPTDGVEIATFSPDGKTLATASWDNMARIWSRQGNELQTLRGHDATVESVAFSPDGETLVTGSWDKTARIWNTRGQLLQTLTGHTAPVESATFSPDNQTVITTGWDNTVRLWNLEGDELQVLEGHSGWVRDADFSPDGSLIATASVDQTVRLWKKAEGGTYQLDRTLWAHGASVNSVDFSPDGKYLVSSDSSGALVVGAVALDLTVDDLLDKGCQWVGDYLANSPYVPDADRQLCEGV